VIRYLDDPAGGAGWGRQGRGAAPDLVDGAQLDNDVPTCRATRTPRLPANGKTVLPVQVLDRFSSVLPRNAVYFPVRLHLDLTELVEEEDGPFGSHEPIPGALRSLQGFEQLHQRISCRWGKR
jgi:hypothetical protein